MSRPRFPKFAVTLDVTVTDARRLIRAARDKAEISGCERGLIKNTRDAVQWLLDPGSSFDEGYEIENCDVEAIHEECFVD